MKTWCWDELSGEITTNEGISMRGWKRQPDSGVIKVWFSARGHVALAVDAETKEEAHLLFMREKPYSEMQ